MSQYYIPSGGGGGSPGGSDTQVQFNDGGAFGGSAGLTWDKTNKVLAVAGGAVTASHPVLSLSQTWNNAAVAFTGLVFNVTNTASDVGSLFLDFQKGGSSYLAFGRAPDADEPKIISNAVSGALRFGNANGAMRILADAGGTTFIQTTQSNVLFSGLFGVAATTIGFSGTNINFVSQAYTATPTVGTGYVVMQVAGVNYKFIVST